MAAQSRFLSLIATAALSLVLPGAAAARAPGSSSGWTFVSAPGLHPPRAQVLEHKPEVAHGDFLAATASATRGGQRSSGQSGPLILDSQAQPVWFLPVKGQAFDLQQQTYDGKPVLVWLQGKMYVIADEHYHELAAFKARSPWMTDIHDAYIVGGDIWITVIRQVRNQNLRPYGGPKKGSVLDVGLQEFQVSTGHLIRTWDALNPGGKPNVPLSASKESAKGGGQRHRGGFIWDAYHLNSVQALSDGDLLVSMRNTWAVYLIDPRTNRIIWALGGKHSTFKLGAGASFAWQHDARLADPADEGRGTDVELTLFNDDNGGRSEHPSEGMALSVNTKDDKATLVSAYRHHPPLSAGAEGSMQMLPNGDALVGWGSEPYFSEYAPAGQELLDVRWPGSVGSYRVLFTNTWVGTPDYPPSGAARGDTVYASWNGATQVARWEVLAGANTTNLKVVVTAARTGFETAIKLNQTHAAYEVRALGATGQVLGTSKAFS